MSLFKSEIRKHPRISSIDTVEFVVDPNSSDGTEYPMEKGITRDVCNKGVCMYTAIPLKKGQKLDIVKGAPPHICTTATVRWIKKLTVQLYRAGLMLCNITHHIDLESRTIFVRAMGEISVYDLIEYEKKVMQDPHFERGLNTLADFTDAKPSYNVNFGTVTYSRDFVKSIQKVRGKCKWAFIAPSDITYGICRMFSFLSAGLDIETGVFRTEDDARKWLGMQ